MKRAVKLYVITILLFAVIFITANIFFGITVHRSEKDSYALMNRVFSEFEQEALSVSSTDNNGITEGTADVGISPDIEISADVYDEIIDDIWYDRISDYESEYGSSALPSKVYFLPAETDSSVGLLNRDSDNEKLWTLQRYGRIEGFMVFEYNGSRYSDLWLTMNVGFMVVFFLLIGICTYIACDVLEPFNTLSAYPEKLSKNQLTEKIPETRNRYFGRFTWGINMLNDRLVSDRNRINELSREHLTMLTTIAHGIKTPVSNIKLYSEAIETGMYQPDGKANASDAEVAAKISKNADDITAIVKELIDKASGGVVAFEPNCSSFYLSELTDFLNEEYGNRLDVLRIPHTFTVESNAMINSDKDGICRVLSQLIENAIKYGNGEGISVNIRKGQEGYYFSVKNKGRVLDEKELPYIFNSFWRGSNSEGVPGSGIGLFECYEIVRRLSGDIYARSDLSGTEMEFEVYLP